MKAKPEDILNVLLDTNQMTEYDCMFNKYEVITYIYILF